jgi:hypothetical protein
MNALILKVLYLFHECSGPEKCEYAHSAYGLSIYKVWSLVCSVGIMRFDFLE